MIQRHLKNWLVQAPDLKLSGSLQDTGIKVRDVRISKCYSWFSNCDAIWDYSLQDDLVTWYRIDIGKMQDTSIGQGFGWTSYVYWQPLYPNERGSAVVDLALSRNGLPLGLANERYNKIKNNDIDGYHVHSNTDNEFYVKDDSSNRFNPDMKWSAKFGNHLEDWFWRGDGIWCKYGRRSNGIKEIKAFIGEDFIESRPMWKEMVHCLHREGYSKPISISFQKSRLDDFTYGKEKDLSQISEPSLVMKRADFKILQISDLHFGRHIVSDSRKEKPDSIFRYDWPNVQFIHSVIRNERPDLAVITGHIFKDFNKNLDYESQILKMVSPIISNGIPFLFTWGEPQVTTEFKVNILNFIKSLPFCLNKFDLKNSTYLMLPLLLPAKTPGSQKQIGTIFAFDSNVTESYNFLDKFPRSPQSVYNLAFQHLPLHEYRPQGSFALIGNYEQKGSLDYIPHTKAFRNLLGEKDIKAISCGHEHGNDCCVLSDGKQQNLKNNMWLCYGGVTGYDQAYESKVRIFKIDTEKNDITSWKRSIKDTSKVSDYQYIWSRTLNTQ